MGRRYSFPKKPDDGLARLRVLAERIEDAEAVVAELKDERDALFVHLREEMERPVSQRRIGAAAGISDVGVINAVRKYKERQAEEAATARR